MAGEEVTVVNKIVIRPAGRARPFRFRPSLRGSLACGDHHRVGPFMQNRVAVRETDGTGAQVGHGRRVLPIEPTLRPKHGPSPDIITAPIGSFHHRKSGGRSQNSRELPIGVSGPPEFMMRLSAEILGARIAVVSPAVGVIKEGGTGGARIARTMIDRQVSAIEIKRVAGDQAVLNRL